MVRNKKKADDITVVKFKETCDKFEDARLNQMNSIDEALKDYFETVKQLYQEVCIAEFDQFAANTFLVEYLVKDHQRSNIVISPNQKEVRWPICGEILFSLNGTPVRTQ